MIRTSRREFLGAAGKGVASAALGFAIAKRLGFAEGLAGIGGLGGIARDRLRFGALDPLVDLMQATPADELLPLLVQRLRAGTPLGDLVGAGALANARAFGGTNYNGYHALMAMMPSYEMAAQMPAPYGALPVLKVMHRNARFLQEIGAAGRDDLEPLGKPEAGDGRDLVAHVRARELAKAEQSLAALESRSGAEAYEELQTVVRDEMNVHRVVLSWRAYDLLKLAGPEQAVTMLRQSVRFCIDEDGIRAGRGQPANRIVELLPELMKRHHLDDGRARGTRTADVAWLESLADTIFASDPATAADAAGSALSRGYDPEEVGAAMSLAATRLLLDDPGQARESAGKPVGSVHGASVGVHASDAANAWRHIARVGTPRTAFASLIAGAYHTAGQSGSVGTRANDEGGAPCTKTDPGELQAEIEGRIRERDQKGACRAARRYCELGHPQKNLFALLLPFAVSQDGALHAEKYFRTAQEEHATARTAHRPLYLVALTRVMASQQGFPAPGCEEARKLLAG